MSSLPRAPCSCGDYDNYSLIVTLISMFRPQNAVNDGGCRNGGTRCEQPAKCCESRARAPSARSNLAPPNEGESPHSDGYFFTHRAGSVSSSRPSSSAFVFSLIFKPPLCISRFFDLVILTAVVLPCVCLTYTPDRPRLRPVCKNEGSLHISGTSFSFVFIAH